MKAKPESVDAVRDACKQAIEAVHSGARLRSLLAARGRRNLRFRRTVGRRRRTEDAQHRARGRRPCSAPSASTSTAHRTSRCCSPSSRATRPRASCVPDGARSHGKVAFITGAARGQGRAEAVRLASDGANIIAVDICDQIASVPYPMATPDDLAATVKLVEDTGARIVAREADVRDQACVEHALQAGLDEFGRLDIVIANAGIAPMAVGRRRAGATSSTSTSPACTTPSRSRYRRWSSRATAGRSC